MKKFIMSCPVQKEGKLGLQKYEVTENPKLEYGETHFPIIPVINGYAEDGETVKLYLIKFRHENSEMNKNILCEEIKRLEKDKNITIIIEDIDAEFSAKIADEFSVFTQLISKFEDNDELYACITFGTKPTPIVQMMAMNYAYLLLKNIYIGCITYGTYNFETKESKISDITPLFYMDEIVNDLSDLKLKDPLKYIEKVLNIDNATEE